MVTWWGTTNGLPSFVGITENTRTHVSNYNIFALRNDPRGPKGHLNRGRFDCKGKGTYYPQSHTLLFIDKLMQIHKLSQATLKANSLKRLET